MKHLFRSTNAVRFAMIATLMILFPACITAQGWNVGPGGNSMRNGQSPQAGPPAPEVLWQGGLNSVLAQQSVTDGNYLAMARTHNIGDVINGTKIVMHHLQTGDTLWTAILPVDFPATDWRSRVSAIRDGRVYCTRAGNNNESYLYALDADTGDILWKSEDVVDEGSTEGLVFAPDGDPIVGSMYYMTRINKEDGSTVWQTERLSYDDGGGAVVANGKVYSIVNLINYVGVAAYDLETGDELYTSPQLSGGFVNQLGMFAGHDGTIYLPRCQNNPVTDSIFALQDDGTMLRRKWAVPIGYTPFATHGVGPDGSVYAYSRSLEIMRLDPENGEVLNTSQSISPAGANSPRMAIDAPGRIFVTNGGFPDGMFYSFDPDLTLRWEVSFPNINVGGPAIGKDGTLVVTGKGTNVVAYVGEGIPEVDFTKVTEGAVVNDGGWNYGMLWTDFNNDNYPDLFVANNDADNGKLNFLYMNNGDGTFEKMTEGAVVNDGGSSYAVTAADVNADDFIDIFVANHNEDNFLYYGNQVGTFEKVTEGPVVSDGGKSVGCAFVDYNLDFHVDIFVANRDQKNFLYRQDHLTSPGVFIKETEGDIVNDIDNSSGCSWGDYDNDGYPDPYVANSGTASCLYHNNQDGTFTKVEEEPFISDVSNCSGASWGDVDNDGDLDLFVSTGQLGMYPDWFYLNNGDGTFTKVTDSPLVNEATWSSGSAWGDYDKDGDLDLAVGGYDGNNLLFKNDGNGNFEKVEDNDFVNDGGYTEGLAWADFDNDGDLDIFTAKNNYFGGNNSLFTNNGNNNNWLKIKLGGDGLYGNRNALGARIYVYATVNGQPLMQMREVSAQTGGGQGGQNDLVQFFGLGDASAVDSVRVVWNLVEYIETNVAINQLHFMYLVLSGVEEMQDEIPSVMVFPNPAIAQATFEIRSTGHQQVSLDIFDLQGRLVYELAKNMPASQGTQMVWNLQDRAGARVKPGVYFCKYLIGKESGVVKVVVR